MRTTIHVASDLTAILDVAERLEEQAIASANDREFPGGLALVALGPVASLDEWSEQLEAAEHRALARRQPLPVIEDGADDWEPPLQTLLFWSEAWRAEHGYPLKPRPTLASEAGFIRWALDWAWANELHWDDFASDVAAVRSRLENLLAEGLRARAGVPCLSDECGGVLLIQPVADRREHRACNGHEVDGAHLCLIPHERCPHDRGGLRDEWTCPKCQRKYDAESYTRAVTQQHYLNAEWLPLDKAAQRAGAKPGTVKVWATRGLVKRRKDVATGATVYRVKDIAKRVESARIGA